MKLSVVIPSLNSEDEIEATLATLKPQLNPGDEIIIVDALSKDRTLEIACRYQCKIILYPNATIGEARNLGVVQARNEVILETDTDVAFPPEYIKRLKAYFEDPSVIGVAGPSQDAKGRALVNASAAIRSAVASLGGPTGEENMAFLKQAFYKTRGFADVNLFEGVQLWSDLRTIGLLVFDPSLFVYHNVASWHWTSLPSYLISAGLLGTGAAYESMVGGAVGSALIGAGAGFGLGQLGVDLGINKDAPPGHFHHWMLALMIMGATMALGDVLSDDIQAGLYGFSTGLFLHDVATESTV